MHPKRVLSVVGLDCVEHKDHALIALHLFVGKEHHPLFALLLIVHHPRIDVMSSGFDLDHFQRFQLVNSVWIIALAISGRNRATASNGRNEKKGVPEKGLHTHIVHQLSRRNKRIMLRLEVIDLLCINQSCSNEIEPRDQRLLGGFIDFESYRLPVNRNRLVRQVDS